MNRESVIKLMCSHGATLIPMYGDKRYHRGYKKRSRECPITLYNSNLGMELGQKSNGLVAVIIDHHTSPKAADFFLPSTGMVFGRPSRPRSHRVYRCMDNMCYTHKLKHGNMQSVELRGDWVYYMMLPSSQRASGETFEFWSTEAPTCVSYEELHTAIHMLNKISRAKYLYRRSPEEFLGRLGQVVIDDHFGQEDRFKYIAACEQYFAAGDPYIDMGPRQLHCLEQAPSPPVSTNSPLFKAENSRHGSWGIRQASF